jgi:uncharacterized protein YyaL (SSP411 family)
LWTCDEIKRILNPNEADLFIKVFDIKDDGNFKGEVAGRETRRNMGKP